MAKTGPKTDWDKEQLDAAVHAYLNDPNSSYRKLAKKYGIPKSTIAHYVKKRKQQIKSKAQSRTVQDSPGQSRTVQDMSGTGLKQSRMSGTPSKKVSRTRPGQQEKQENVADPGRTLGQVHAERFNSLQRNVRLLVGCAFLAGALVEEFTYYKTGKSFLGWLSEKFGAKQSTQVVQESSEETLEAIEVEKEDVFHGFTQLPENSRYRDSDLNIG